MADEPQVDLDLANLKNSKVAKVKVKYEKLKSKKEVKHRASWFGLADDWLKRRLNQNRIESTWDTSSTQILESADNPFKIPATAVPSGTGEADLEWTVWAESNKIPNNNQVELYSVMRAEEWYIGKKGHQKLASKYFGDWYGPSENFGIDSFFKDGSKYVVCESKFTRDGQNEFTDWKKMRGRAKDEWIWNDRLWKDKRKKPCPMSWAWIEKRAARAEEDPPIQIVPRDDIGNQRVVDEVIELNNAIEKPTNIARFVNFFGAKEVPIYPGRYRFKCAERGKPSNNLLHLKWTFTVDHGTEFTRLGLRFDKWVDKQMKKKKK
jgi:hypothetical protein